MTPPRHEPRSQTVLPFGSVRCLRCQRVLRDERSIKRRLGPTCHKKGQATR